MVEQGLIHSGWDKGHKERAPKEETSDKMASPKSSLRDSLRHSPRKLSNPTVALKPIKLNITWPPQIPLGKLLSSSHGPQAGHMLCLISSGLRNGMRLIGFLWSVFPTTTTPGTWIKSSPLRKKKVGFLLTLQVTGFPTAVQAPWGSVRAYSSPQHYREAILPAKSYAPHCQPLTPVLLYQLLRVLSSF